MVVITALYDLFRCDSVYVLACFVALGRQNITCEDTNIRYCDGDGLVVQNSSTIRIDAGRYNK